jgi:hypothetical protein|tara:strand:- start:541 stop:987 length:447 start_codon:yes stop_codon:yes gene_type:complete
MRRNMTLQEIQTLWSKDAEVDRTALGEEASKIPQLHSKYFKIFSTERLKLRQMELVSKQLYTDLWEYYQGNFDYEMCEEKGWEPFQLKILKSDITFYIDRNQDWVDSQLKLAMQKEKVDFLESIIKSLNGRGFNINAAINWEKFKVGI